MPTRRELLVLGAATGAALAGCLSESDDAGSGVDGTDGGGGDGTDAETSTATDEGTGAGTPVAATPTTPTSTGSASATTAAGFTLRTPAFDSGGSVPRRYTCDGADVSPALAVGGVPGDAASLALVVDDPDADGFTHWLCWNLPPGVETIPAERPRERTLDSPEGAIQGTNGFGEIGYLGPCPPEGDGVHTYRFSLAALSTTLDLDPGAEREAFDAALGDAEIARARLTGTYER
jgi:Raf kinase inhibitor-like YbhB/YbcL family protein